MSPLRPVRPARHPAPASAGLAGISDKMTSRRGETTNQTDGSSFKRDSSVKMMSNFLHQGENRVEEGWSFFYLRRCVDQSFGVHSEWVYMQSEAFNESYSLPTAVDKVTPDRQISLVESGKRLHTFIWVRRSVCQYSISLSDTSVLFSVE